MRREERGICALYLGELVPFARLGNGSRLSNVHPQSALDQKAATNALTRTVAFLYNPAHAFSLEQHPAAFGLDDLPDWHSHARLSFHDP